MLMILFSVLSVIRHLICGNNLNWLLNLNLIYEMLGLTFSSKLDLGSYIISIAKTASKKIGALICFMKFLSLFLYNFTICPCMEYCCHIWCPSCYLELLDSYKSEYTGLLVLHLLLLLNPWLILKMWPAQGFSIGIT